MAKPTSTWTLTGRWVFPVDGPPRERGFVTIDDDRIVHVGPARQLFADIDLGDAAILPGLVNAHTHLDLSGMRGLAPPTAGFTSWLRQVIAHRRGRSSEAVQTDINAGLKESLKSGTTLIGDIAAAGQSWPALQTVPMRAVVFHELIGLRYERALSALVEAVSWLDNCISTTSCRPGLSPHAPYSVSATLFATAADLAKKRNLPLAVHLAETSAELELLHVGEGELPDLAKRRGPFVAFLKELGVWEPQELVSSPEMVMDLSAPARPRLLIHGNYLKRNTAVRPSDTIVYCPRTHAAFGHPPHPFREFLARGVRVAVGTDGLASNPDLDVLAEIRFLHRLYPDIPGATLLRMATLSGAEALGWADETGSLTPGKSADLVVVPLCGDDADPHRLLLGGDAPVSRVLFRGRWVGPSAA